MKHRPAATLPFWRTGWISYFFAVAATGVTLWLRLAVGYDEGDPPLLMLFIIPIMLSAYLGGLGPGLVATGLAIIGGNYYLLPPLHSFVLDGVNQPGLITLIAVGVLLSVLIKLLRASRDHLKETLERAVWLASFPERNPNPIVELGLTDDVIYYINPAARQLFPDLEIKKSQHPLLAGLQAACQTSLDAPEGVLRREIKAGAYLFSQTVAVVRENQRLRVYSTDITASKLAEAKLRESEDRFASVFRDSPVAMNLNRLEDGKIIDANGAWMRLTGFSLAEAAGRSSVELGLVERASAEKSRALLRSTGVVPMGEYSLQTRAGEKKVVLASGKVIQVAGEPCSLASILDITERKQAEWALEASEERYRNTLDNMIEGCQLIGFDWEYLYLNRAASLHNRRPNEELIGRKMPEMWPGIETTKVFAMFRRCLEERIALHDEIEFIFPDGGKGWFDVHGQPTPDGIFVLSIDITERKKAEVEAKGSEQALRDSEARFRALFERSPVGVAQGDIATIGFMSVNQRFCEIVGYPRAELVTMNFKQFTHPDDLPADLKNFERLVAGTVRHYEMEKRYIQKSGAVVWVSLTVVPLWAAGEKPDYYMAVIEDITERKRAVEALRESQALYYSLVDQMPAGIFRKDKAGRYVFVSSAFCQLKAAKPEQFLGRTALELGLEDDMLAESGANHHLQIMQTGRMVEVEEEYVHPDGRKLYFHVVKSPVFDSDAEITGTQGILFDITERKHAEARYENLFSTLIEGFCTIDVIFDAGGRPVDYRFLEVNPAFEKQTGLHGVQGKLMRDLAPDHEQHWFDTYGKIALSGEPLHFENEAKALGRFYDVHAYRIGGAESRKVAILFNDITQRKHAEAEIKKLNAGLELRVAERTEQLEAANKELEAFSYSVSHDLRAPLRAVNGFAGIVLEDYGSLLPEDGRKYLARIRNGGQQMGQLIDDLLAFSRLSRQSMDRHKVDVARVVKDVVDELKLHWGEDRQIEMRIGDLPVCQGDKSLLKQVWINLISNAVKYSRGRKPAIVEIGCLCEIKGNTYFVRDNGTGFDMQYAHKLFGVFQRLHRADEFEGTGVGLAIVQRVIHRHGGRVWAEAKPGEGATFYFTLEAETTL